MSIFRKIVGIAAPVVGGILGGPAGFAIGSALGGAVQKSPAAVSPAMTPTMGASIMPALGALPPIVGRSLPAIGGAIGGAVIAGGRAVARSAITYCNRHPAWCSTVGGTAAVAAMIEAGQLPAIRRRRGRGITPKDLRSFRRVANLVRGFCPTVRRIPTRSLHVRKTGITHA